MIQPSYFNISCPDGNTLLYCNKPSQLSGGTLTSALGGMDGSEIDRFLIVEYTSKAGTIYTAIYSYLGKVSNLRLKQLSVSAAVASFLVAGMVIGGNANNIITIYFISYKTL